MKKQFITLIALAIVAGSCGQLRKTLTDKNLPPIEPYLTSNIRPNEQLYPWKRYTDRGKFIIYNGDDYCDIIIEKDGRQHCFLFRPFIFEDDAWAYHGDIIDFTWSVDSVNYYDPYYDRNRLEFIDRAHSIRIVEAGATSRFEKKYGAIPNIKYFDEGLEPEIEVKSCNKLYDYLLTSKDAKIVEALKIFSDDRDRLQITMLGFYSSWYESKQGIRGTVPGYGIDLVLLEEDGLSKVSTIMGFVYNPDTDTFYIDVDTYLE